MTRPAATTYLLRHAPSAYSVDYRVNGDPAVDVPLTSDGVAECRVARWAVPSENLGTCVTSAFGRCIRTAEWVVAGRAEVYVDPRLNELDYGAFEGAAFLDYARWLIEHGPHVRPPGAGESQTEGIERMLAGLRGVLERPGPRLVVAHGLLVSVIQWAQAFPQQSLTEVFLPPAPCLKPVLIDDEELQVLTGWLLCDLASAQDRGWHVDLGVFPREAQAALATVGTHASANRDEDEATHA
ncbi:histidine phosphatase family protein [Amycolatopsis palatopharyngis]|uniref:histidine phosphatase family protein n=1 Tax=Amycolatopsis palatopharyngis TaxID=187982 RepID=UPI000E22DD83|nr:histidine phosphatase family protein [Amycolatopsis palatopharyngis]